MSVFQRRKISDTAPALPDVLCAWETLCRNQNCSGTFLLSLDSSNQKLWASRAIWDSCCQAVLLVLFPIHPSLKWPGYYDNGHLRNIYEFCTECRMWFFSQSKNFKLSWSGFLLPFSFSQYPLDVCSWNIETPIYAFLLLGWFNTQLGEPGVMNTSSGGLSLALHSAENALFCTHLCHKVWFSGETRSPVYRK